MTFSIGRVAGGTNAGRRRVRDVKREPWQCECPNPEGRSSRYALRDARLTRCPDCGVPRPLPAPTSTLRGITR